MNTSQTPFSDHKVEAAFRSFPEPERQHLLALRELIFNVADHSDGIGQIFETLKWGQPAYLTPETKSGTTIRLGLPKTGGFAIYTHCQTTVISEFRDLFPKLGHYEGNRGIHLVCGDDLPLANLELLFHRALTYHQ